MKKIFVILILLLILFGCKKNKKEVIVASVNQEKLTMQEFKNNFTSSEWTDLSNEDKQIFIKQWIDMILLAQAAQSENLINEKVNNKVKYSGYKIKGNLFISKSLNEIEVTEEELLEYYNININEYKTTKKELKIQQIFSKSKSKINSLKQKIWNGLSFKQVAIEFSEDKYASNGGYAGFVSENDLGKEIWNKLINTKKYVFIQAEKDDGYYLLRYYRTREIETSKSFLDVKENLKKEILKLKKEEIYDKLIRELKSKAEIINTNI